MALRYPAGPEVMLNAKPQAINSTSPSSPKKMQETVDMAFVMLCEKP